MTIKEYFDECIARLNNNEFFANMSKGEKYYHAFTATCTVFELTENDLYCELYGHNFDF